MLNDNDLSIDREALLNVPSAVGVFDLKDGVIEMRYLNDSFYNMIGAKREERTCFFATNTINSVHPDDRAGILEEGLKSIKENRMFEYRFRNLDGDGNYLWIGIRATHKPIDSGTERFYASYYNVDSYVNEQNKLQSSVDYYVKILSNLPGGVALFNYQNNQFKMVYANEFFYKLRGRIPEDPCDDYSDWIVEEDFPYVQQKLKDFASGGKQIDTMIYRARGEDGVIRWISSTISYAVFDEASPLFFSALVDITQQKKEEQEAIKIKRMYDDAALEAKLLIFEYDEDTKKAHMMQSGYTATVCEELGIPAVIDNPKEMLEKYVDDRDIKILNDAYKAVEKGVMATSVELRLQLPGQREQQVEKMTFRRITDNNGRLLTIHCCGQNVTARHKAQVEYDKVREKMTSDLTDAVGSFQMNLSRNMFVSGYSPYPQVITALTTKTADEHFEATAYTILNEDIKQEVLKTYTCSNLIELYTNGVNQITKDYPVKTSTGGVMWVRALLHMMTNPSTGEVEGISYCKDITREKRNEEILARIASDSCDFVGVSDFIEDSFRISFCNWKTDITKVGQAYKIGEVSKGFAEKYIPRENRKSFIDSIDTELIMCKLAESQKYTVPFDFVEPSHPKTTLKKQFVFCWLNDDHREVLVLQQDLTLAYMQQAKHNAQLLRAMRESQHANSMKTEFLSNLSHDMRTPLNAILGYSRFALKATDIDEKNNYITKTCDAGSILLKLINDTLDLSKIESGTITLKPEPIRCEEIIKHVLESVKPDLESKKITLHMDNSRAVMATIKIDSLRVQEIFINLMNNAIKFTPEGGEIFLSIECIKLTEKYVRDQLTIRDTGCGMSSEFLTKIFEPFTQERTEANANSGGSGLGLSIVKRLVDLMGGTIAVKSELGVGSEFVVCLDLERVEEEIHTSVEQQRNIVALEGKRVLVAEDNAMNREIVIELLRVCGVVTDIAENGKICLDMLAASDRWKYSAVLMDIRMPVMNGLDATAEIRRMEREDIKNLPIIAMTADAFDDDVQRCLDAGMNGHIAKPINPEELYRKLADSIKT